jgi:hypothetical protein
MLFERVLQIVAWVDNRCSGFGTRWLGAWECSVRLRLRRLQIFVPIIIMPQKGSCWTPAQAFTPVSLRQSRLLSKLLILSTLQNDFETEAASSAGLGIPDNWSWRLETTSARTLIKWTPFLRRPSSFLPSISGLLLWKVTSRPRAWVQWGMGLGIGVLGVRGAWGWWFEGCVEECVVGGVTYAGAQWRNVPACPTEHPRARRSNPFLLPAIASHGKYRKPQFRESAPVILQQSFDFQTPLPLFITRLAPWVIIVAFRSRTTKLKLETTSPFSSG